jgi:cytochrome P450
MILFYVYTNPRVLNKLRAELAKARPSSPIRNAEANNLPYLQAVIKEGLRICPPITGIMFKDVPAEGDTWNGKFIPGGTIIGYSVMGICMNREVWGDDVHAFRPERFLEGSTAELEEREAVADSSFGFGRWRCLGRNIALIELNKAVTEVSTMGLSPSAAMESTNQ